MVLDENRSKIDDLHVEGSRLLRNRRLIAEFPTPICELARLDERLFVILHPYPAERQREFAGTNLWSLNLDGEVLWKARYLASTRGFEYQNSYRGINIFDIAHPKIAIDTMNDYRRPVIDAMSGEELGGIGVVCRGADVINGLLAKSTVYLLVDPNSPPELCIPR